MRWPWSSSSDAEDNEAKTPLHPPGRKPIYWDQSLNAIDWQHFTQPSVIIPTALLTLTTLALVRAYKIFLRRIPNAEHIKPEAFRKRSIFGKVTSVGDGDNFRLFHTPGGRLTGWGWFPGRRVPIKREELSAKTVHIRIAGVDAPELAHFGRPAQPFGKEALDFLTSYILNHRVRAHLHRRDQYERAVGTVFVRKWGIKRDVGLEMLKRGLATVYEAKFGAEFGSFEERYRAAEKRAREQKVGMWSQPNILQRIMGVSNKPLESPREYKTRMTAQEKKDSGAKK